MAFKKAESSDELIVRLVEMDGKPAANGLQEIIAKIGKRRT